MDTFLTVREAAAVLRISKSKAYELVSSGELPHVRFGKVVRISQASLLQWLEKKERASASRREDSPWPSGLMGRD